MQFQQRTQEQIDATREAARTRLEAHVAFVNTLSRITLAEFHRIQPVEEVEDELGVEDYTFYLLLEGAEMVDVSWAEEWAGGEEGAPGLFEVWSYDRHGHEFCVGRFPGETLVVYE